MKNFIVVFALMPLAVISCKKKKTETPAVAVAPVVDFGTVDVTTLNDTVDFSTTGNSFDFSIGIYYDGVVPSAPSPSDYYIQSTDAASGTFATNQKLEINARNGNKLILSDNLGGNAKMYTQGSTVTTGVNYTTATTPNSAVGARILEQGITSEFGLNGTFYIGTSFLRNGLFHNGWIKIKTLNNNHSCVVVSYGVCKTAGKAVKTE